MARTDGRPSSGDGTPRPRRADAQRNVDALLRAAKSTFATTGVDAPAKEITDLAGVGIGTLYRHFPRRSDLILAVLQHEIDDCIQAAQTLAAALEPGEALLAWIDRYTNLVATKHGLAGALHSGDPAYADLARVLLDRLEPTIDELLTNTDANARPRQDVTARDVLITVALICQPVPGRPATFNKRMVRVFTESLLQTPRNDLG